ncbi:P-type DNA transfer ATPase VirB11 [Arhodomonas sp. AD133]|uniref:P-type DNA transfer ATPase VirB11 n=1 Tax=Arhodomonas sp. AD133 TaxID=3415009 RepID=UPI003EBE3E70
MSEQAVDTSVSSAAAAGPAGPVRHFLAPLLDFLAYEDTNEVCVNEPGVVFVERHGAITRHEVPELTLEHLEGLARLIASFNDQRIDETQPLLSGTLPDGERVQVVMPPAVEPGTVVLAIRKPSVLDRTLDDYEAEGAFESVEVRNQGLPEADRELLDCLNGGDYSAFIRRAVQLRKNIVVSGGTSTGKTTFTNALLKEIPADERLITIEDAREVRIANPNRVHLLYSKGDQGTAQLTPADLIVACLRLRPDRILLSEVRSTEALDFLEAVGSGHPGSITTVHADSPQEAVSRLAREIMKAGTVMKREEIVADIYAVIDVIVQLKRVGGRRVVTEVFYDPERKLG